MDIEVKQLIGRFPENNESEDPFAELEDDTEPGHFYDRLVVGLAQGDIVKGIEIMEKVTIIQALNWLLMRMNNE